MIDFFDKSLLSEGIYNENKTSINYNGIILYFDSVLSYMKYTILTDDFAYLKSLSYIDNYDAFKIRVLKYMNGSYTVNDINKMSLKELTSFYNNVMLVVESDNKKLNK